MKTKFSNAQKIMQVAEDNGWQFRLRYSGRGMFGKSCPGIVCKGYDTSEVAIAFREAGIKSRSSQDNMGLNMIVYWPSIASDPATYEVEDE